VALLLIPGAGMIRLQANTQPVVKIAWNPSRPDGPSQLQQGWGTSQQWVNEGETALELKGSCK